MSDLFDCREAFATTLEELASTDQSIVVVVNDSISSTRLGGFKKLYPERFINVGIAEQNMVGVGAGLASAGKVPFVCGASCFLTGRALEQVKVDLGYAKNNVKLCGMSSGVAYGELGPTHHSIEDFAWTRVIGNLVVVAPADPIETRSMLRAIAAYQGPVFFRLSRMPVPNVHAEDYQFRLGKASRLREGGDLTIIANGVMVARALAAAEALEAEGISSRVLNMSSIKPLDADAVVAAARETGAIVTVEEHSIYGGLGGAVAEVVAGSFPVRVHIMGFPGFAPTGSASFLLEHFGLTADGIAEAARGLVSKRGA